MQGIGAHVGYTANNSIGQGLEGSKGRSAKIMCYYPAAPSCHVMAVRSGTRVVQVLCAVMVALAVWRLVLASELRPSVLGYALRPLVVHRLNASCF